MASLVRVRVRVKVRARVRARVRVRVTHRRDLGAVASMLEVAYFSLHLPISPCISCAPGALLRHFRMHGRTVDDHTGRWGRCSRTIDVGRYREI